MNRRQLIKLLSSLPLFAALPSIAADKADKAKPEAKPAAKTGGNMLSEDDNLAKAMQYKADASKAPAMRTNKEAFCYNCSKYNVCAAVDKNCKPLSDADLKKAEAAACQIFPEKLVAKNGWCLSWQAKA